MDTRILELEKKYDKAEIENKALQLQNRNILLGFISALALLLFMVLAQYAFRLKSKKKLAEQRSIILEKEKLLSDERQAHIEEEKNRVEKQLNENRLILSFFHHISYKNREVKNLLYDLKIHTVIEKDLSLHRRIMETYESYNKKTALTEIFLSDKQLNEIIGLPEKDAARINRSDKILLMLTLMHANSSEIALLFNTSPVSIRNRKTKLKKKLRDENISLSNEVSLNLLSHEM